VLPVLGERIFYYNTVLDFLFKKIFFFSKYTSIDINDLFKTQFKTWKKLISYIKTYLKIT